MLIIVLYLRIRYTYYLTLVYMDNLPQKYGHTVLPGMPFTYNYKGIEITIIFSWIDYNNTFHQLAARMIEEGKYDKRIFN